MSRRWFELWSNNVENMSLRRILDAVRKHTFKKIHMADTHIDSPQILTVSGASRLTYRPKDYAKVIKIDVRTHTHTHTRTREKELKKFTCGRRRPLIFSPPNATRLFIKTENQNALKNLNWNSEKCAIMGRVSFIKLSVQWRTRGQMPIFDTALKKSVLPMIKWRV